MVASTGMASACLSSLILGSFMCTLVVFCRKFSLNPGMFILIRGLQQTLLMLPLRQHRSSHRGVSGRPRHFVLDGARLNFPHQFRKHTTAARCRNYLVHIFVRLRVLSETEPLCSESHHARLDTFIRRHGYQFGNWHHLRPLCLTLQRLRAFGCYY